MIRIRTIALLAALLTALALIAAACGGGGSDDPEKVVEEATLKGVESGTIDANLSFHGEEGDTKVHLSGPFRSGGEGELPEFALDLNAKGDAGGEAVDLEADLTVLSDRAFLGLEGTEYEVDPTTFGFVKSSFEQSQQKEGEKGSQVTACQEAATSLDFTKLLENPTAKAGVEVDGTPTTKVSGTPQSDAAVDAVIELLQDPACKSQLEAAGELTPLSQLESSKKELSEALKGAHVDLYVGDDHIIRKVLLQLEIAQPGTSKEAEAVIEATLSGVNEEQDISAPAKAEPLEKLFQELGVNPLELFESLGSGGIGGLLEGLTAGSGLGGIGGLGGGSSPGGGGDSAQREYGECLKEAQTSTDLQKCASRLQ